MKIVGENITLTRKEQNPIVEQAVTNALEIISERYGQHWDIGQTWV